MTISSLVKRSKFVWKLEFQPKIREYFTITEKAPTRAKYLSLKHHLEVLHAPVVHQLLPDLPGGGPPEEHVDQKQEEDRGVEYRQRGGAHLKMGKQ